ncbi:pentapeptide repeat-containing protein [Deinococcus saxicola]|uniref:pentapeptide repeat-containing protein n=1 Tax=Deinococcus saxicola TaxID=249406 RepID=UPI003D12FADA
MERRVTPVSPERPGSEHTDSGQTGSRHANFRHANFRHADFRHADSGQTGPKQTVHFAGDSALTFSIRPTSRASSPLPASPRNRSKSPRCT